MSSDLIIAPPHPDTIPETIMVDVEPSGTVAVTEDNDVINHVQRRRLALIEDISPDGRVANPKERYLYMALLKDTADSAQTRITAQNKADDSERDRQLVAAAMAQLKGERVVGEQLPETGSIPTPPKRMTTREIDPGILAKETREETHDEFRARMDEEMHNKLQNEE